MSREIVLDTETTGFEPHLGHRLVEVAALEIEDLLPTGRSFHAYIDP
jgi:DNA polymerase-3 subunit epsilon